MSIIEKINNKGTVIWKCTITKNDQVIVKQFSSEDEAKIYSWYKERLLDLMDTYELNIKDTITLEQIFDLNKNVTDVGQRTNNGKHNACARFVAIFGSNRSYSSITFEEWSNAAHTLFGEKVSRGSKEKNRDMAPKTLRNIFANASAAISYAQSQGIQLDNHALKVVQTVIAPLIKETIR